MKYLACIIALASLAAPAQASDDKVLKLYHDADWSNHIESAQSIWRGFDLALNEIDHSIQGYRIELVKKNHSGNVTRSLSNYEDYLEDDQALAVISGIHSAPLIKNRGFINENSALTLVPWAAGGPITRHPSTENWIFRLSLDDMQVGEVLIEYALDVKGCKAPHLLLEDTSWGDSNARNMNMALAKRNTQPSGITRFSWNMKSHVARSKLQDLKENGADCIVLVANAIEGSQLAISMSELDVDMRLPIISHWGITGGNFHEIVNAKTREDIDLSFVQSCFSFNQEPLSPKGRDVLAQAMARYPADIMKPSDIRSPTGLIHGHDLGQLLIAALKTVVLTDDIKKNRDNVRVALESLQAPVDGLVKTYNVPFSPYSSTNIDAHEALGADDYCLAVFGPNDEIFVKEKT